MSVQIFRVNTVNLRSGNLPIFKRTGFSVKNFSETCDKSVALCLRASLPCVHMPFIQRRINVDETPYFLYNVGLTSMKRHIFYTTSDLRRCIVRTSVQCRINVDATSRRCIDVNATMYFYTNVQCRINVDASTLMRRCIKSFACWMVSTTCKLHVFCVFV